jgi:V8-like Glu-specific endopeptidase
MKSFLGLLTVIAISLPSAGFALPIHGNKSFTAEELQTVFSDKAYNYEGIVALSNCSGSLIRFENSNDTDKALILSNGHCVPVGFGGGMIKPNTFIANQAVRRSFRFLSPTGGSTSNYVNSTKIVYATMTGTDVSVYELELSYAEIKAKYNVSARVVDSQHPQANEAIDILSGYWHKGYSCTIDGFVYMLKEDAYTSTDSIRYVRGGCKTIHGTSGSPILSANTGKVIGINNTGNDNGERCTMDNPCEVSTTGAIYVEKGRSYGQQTYIFYSCLNADRKLDVTVPGCQLFH